MKVLCQLSIFLLTWQGHLNASTLSQAFLRPIALITDADNALHNPPDNRDKDLLDSVVSTLRKGGLSPPPRLLSSVASNVVPPRREKTACLSCCRVLQDSTKLYLKSLETFVCSRDHPSAGGCCMQGP